MVRQGLNHSFPAVRGPIRAWSPSGDYLELVQGEQVGEFVPVVLELLPSVPDVGVLVGGILELDDAQGQPVQEQDDVGPSG